MPPKNEMYPADEAIRELIERYRISRRMAEDAVWSARADGESRIPEIGVVVRRLYSVPGPPQFEITGTGR